MNAPKSKPASTPSTPPPKTDPVKARRLQEIEAQRRGLKQNKMPKG